MTKPPLEYETNSGTRRSHLALIALSFTAAAGACLALAYLVNSDAIGFLSLPIALIGTILTLVAFFRKASFSILAAISFGVAAVYWTAIAAMIVPKLLAMQRTA